MKKGRLIICLAVVLSLILVVPVGAFDFGCGGSDEVTNNYYNTYDHRNILHASINTHISNDIRQNQFQNQDQRQLQVMNDGDQITDVKIVKTTSTAPPQMDLSFVTVVPGTVNFSSEKYGTIISGEWKVRWWTKDTPTTGQLDIKKWIFYGIDRVEDQDVIRWVADNYAGFADKHRGHICIRTESRQAVKGTGNTTGGGSTANPTTNVGAALIGMFGRTVSEATEYTIITVYTTLSQGMTVKEVISSE